MRISDWSSDVCSSDLYAGARTIFVDGFHRHVPVGVRLGAYDLGEELFGSRVAVQDAILPAFFVDQYELDCDAGLARPVGFGRGAGVAEKNTRVVFLSHNQRIGRVFRWEKWGRNG